jgi:HEAT repeat protein
MRLTVRLAFLLLVMPACTTKAPPVARRAPLAHANPSVASQAVSAHPDAVAPLLGRTLSQWEEQLSSKDLAARQRATLALGQLGEAGYPALLNGMKNESADVRLQSLQAIYRPVLVQHQAETVPLLLQLLQDPNPAVREHAAIRLAWFDVRVSNMTPRAGYYARERLQALRLLAQKDETPAAKNAALHSIQSIEDAIQGKVRADK